MRLIIFVLVFFLQSNFCWAWDEASARQEAFRKVQHKIDISLYPNRDPYYQENLKAIKEGRNRVSNRFITVEDFGYVVSELNENGKQKITMFYDRQGNLIILRLISSPGFPRTEYIYCALETCQNYGKKHQKGDLMRVTFHPEINHFFYFKPDGTLDQELKDK